MYEYGAGLAAFGYVLWWRFNGFSLPGQFLNSSDAKLQPFRHNFTMVKLYKQLQQLYLCW